MTKILVLIFSILLIGMVSSAVYQIPGYEEQPTIINEVENIPEDIIVETIKIKDDSFPIGGWIISFIVLICGVFAFIQLKKKEFLSKIINKIKFNNLFKKKEIVLPIKQDEAEEIINKEFESDGDEDKAEAGEEKEEDKEVKEIEPKDETNTENEVNTKEEDKEVENFLNNMKEDFKDKKVGDLR